MRPTRRIRILPTTLTILILLSLSSLGLAQDSAQVPLGSSAATGSGAGSGVGAGGDPAGLSDLVSKANGYLSTGKFSDAVKMYSEAIDLSPIDYLLYYKRATSYYSLQKHQLALLDFDKVLELTERGFEKALLMKARIYAKEGMWSEARGAARAYLAGVKAIPASGSGSGVKEGSGVSGAIEDAQALLSQIQQGEQLMTQAKKARSARLNAACVDACTEAIRVASHDVELRKLRAECALSAGDVRQAVVDLVRTTHLSNPPTALFTRIAYLSFFLQPPSLSSSSQAQHQQTLKQCLHLDPDSKACASLHRQLKKLDKELDKMRNMKERKEWVQLTKLIAGSTGSGSEGTNTGTGLAKTFDELLEKAVPEMMLSPKSKSDASELPHPTKWSPVRQEIYLAACIGYSNLNLHTKGEKWCDEAIEFTPVHASASFGEESDSDSESDSANPKANKNNDANIVDALIAKSDAHFAREEFEDAVRFLERAWEGCGRSRQDVAQKLQKAQKVLKQSRRKDYYKILGVARDADERAVKKAYRRAAKSAHPDKGGSEEKMAAVNEAYEVLSNSELRQRFDNGEDPMDPTANQGPVYQQGAGGNPFAAFFQQSGGGGAGGFPFQFTQSGGGHGHGQQKAGGNAGGFKFQWTQGH